MALKLHFKFSNSSVQNESIPIQKSETRNPPTKYRVLQKGQIQGVEQPGNVENLEMSGSLKVSPKGLVKVRELRKYWKSRKIQGILYSC